MFTDIPGTNEAIFGWIETQPNKQQLYENLLLGVPTLIVKVPVQDLDFLTNYLNKVRPESRPKILYDQSLIY